MFRFDEKHEIVVGRNESGFDRACDEAYRSALQKFRIDEDGHSSAVKGWERSQCWIELEFKSYSRSGCNHTYVFTASAKQNVDEE
jgi:hypothetical protein